MKKFLIKIIKKFQTVYCEECRHSIKNDHDFWGTDQLMCLKSPISVDCSDKEDYITRKKKCIVHSFNGCQTAKQCSFCFKFESKDNSIPPPIVQIPVFNVK